MNKYSLDELIKKSGVEDKFALTRLAIRRVRELAKEKDKRALLNSTKLTTCVLNELQEGKIKNSTSNEARQTNLPAEKPNNEQKAES
ncbi:DNA-directed RNA polymerase subunit omega [Candidatus Aerophobetes bacterium]|nr:DNA-directed RNA polymerase subunit omega [Candidatus Aerophobetes bacterium]